MLSDHERLAKARLGRARVWAGDPICDHIWKSSTDETWDRLLLDCLHCEATIVVSFATGREAGWGAS